MNFKYILYILQSNIKILKILNLHILLSNVIIYILYIVIKRKKNPAFIYILIKHRKSRVYICIFVIICKYLHFIYIYI